MLLADRLHSSPIQVVAHRTLPGTGHEIARAARVSPKRSRQRFRLSPGTQQGEERVLDANPQRQQGIARLVRQDSRGWVKSARKAAACATSHSHAATGPAGGEISGLGS